MKVDQEGAHVVLQSRGLDTIFNQRWDGAVLTFDREWWGQSNRLRIQRICHSRCPGSLTLMSQGQRFLIRTLILGITGIENLTSAFGKNLELCYLHY